MSEKQLESSIDANKSTHKLNDDLLPKSLASQEKLTKCSLVLAGLSIAFIGITAYIQYKDKTDQRLDELKQEVKETSKKLESIQTSLKEINSSIRIVSTDTLFVKQKN